MGASGQRKRRAGKGTQATRETQVLRQLPCCSISPVFLVDPASGLILEANAKAEALSGRPAAELLRLDIRELFAPDDAGRIASRLRNPDLTAAVTLPELRLLASNA
ncbi:MAG: PAS domain-containing protein, partial [Lentisphaerae bacterium]|nr:PAS domain-containing protein [Lentisphaerota bacterium]